MTRRQSNSKLYLLISLIPSVKLQEFRRHQFSEFAALDFLMRILFRICRRDLTDNIIIFKWTGMERINVCVELLLYRLFRNLFGYQ